MNISVSDTSGVIGKNLFYTLDNIFSGKDKRYPQLTSDGTDEVYIYVSGEGGENIDEVIKKNCRIIAILDENELAAVQNCNTLKMQIYRKPEIFGKWAEKSRVGQMCIKAASGFFAEGLSDEKVKLCYIDDICDEIIAEIICPNSCYGVKDFSSVYEVSLNEISKLLRNFYKNRESKYISDMTGFSKCLYSTWLSYLPEGSFAYGVKMNCDERGSFTELFKSINHGQVSVNISKPGITKGNHWHHTKNEKFAVVYGKGVIRFRRPDSDKVIEYFVSGDDIKVVDIPTGYTHNIENLGSGDMVTVMWCNECFDPEKPDTYFLPVEENTDAGKEEGKKKVLVLGCNGMAGHLISLYLSERGFDVFGIDVKEPAVVKGIAADVRDTALLKRIIDEGGYDAIINCIAILNKAAEANKSLAVYLNSYLPNLLADLTVGTKTKVLHISTDCVFSGEKGEYKEYDLRDGTAFYDRSKALGELDDDKNITLRTSIIGPDINPNGPSLLNWFMSCEGEVNGYKKTMWTGITTLEAAKIMEAAILEDANGLYNMIPDKSISKYELLKLFSKYLRNGKINVNGVDGTVSNKSLVRTNFSFGYRVPDYEIMIKELADWIASHKELYPHYKEH